MNPELLGILLPVLAAGVCLLLMARLVTAALKIILLALVIWIVVQFAAGRLILPFPFPTPGKPAPTKIKKAETQLYGPRLLA